MLVPPQKANNWSFIMAKAFKKGKAYMKGELMKKHGSFEDDNQDSPPGKLFFSITPERYH